MKDLKQKVKYAVIFLLGIVYTLLFQFSWYCVKQPEPLSDMLFYLSAFSIISLLASTGYIIVSVIVFILDCFDS